LKAATVAKDKRIGLLNEEFKRGLVSEEEYATRRADIEYQAAVKILRINIKLAEDLLKASTGNDVLAAEQKLADLKIQLSDLTTKHEIDNTKKVQAAEQEKYNQIEKSLQGVIKISDQVFGIIGGAIDANSIAKKNSLQEESDLLDKNTQKEIDAVNLTTASQQDKAAQIAIINARAQAQKEQIAIKERQLDQQRAQFDKAVSIAKIIEETAVAVVHQLGTGDPYTATARAFLAGAIGGAQLAIAIATPIPKFKTGRLSGNETLGIVGDGGKQEVMYSPDMKEAIVTPATDTLAYIPKDWGIAPSVEEFQQRAFQMAGRPLNSMPAASNDNRIFGMMVREINGLKVAIMGRPINETNLTKEGLEQIYIDGNNTTRYLNGKV
jgi:hypothetical protein